MDPQLSIGEVVEWGGTSRVFVRTPGGRLDLETEKPEILQEGVTITPSGKGHNITVRGDRERTNQVLRALRELVRTR